MTVYRCRILKPKESTWHTVTAERPEDAANDFFFDNSDRLRFYCVGILDDTTRTWARFARVEVEGHGEWIARSYETQPIRRKGGVKPFGFRPTRIEEIAQQLGWEHPPEDLLGAGWDGEDPGVGDWRNESLLL